MVKPNSIRTDFAAERLRRSGILRKRKRNSGGVMNQSICGSLVIVFAM
jgi:hypothetical protein